MIERDLRKLVRTKWSGWVDWLEPRGNAGIGRPDADFLFEGSIMPVELKVGRCIHEGDHLFAVVIRPDQVSWQHRFYAAGGTSLFMIADGPQDIWVGRKLVMNVGRDKWMFDDSWRLDVSDFNASLKGIFDDAK